MNHRKKLLAAALAALLALPVPGARAASGAPAVSCGAAVLMEKETGTILYEQNSHDKLEPASVTKIMTLLLVMEAIDSGRISLDQTVTMSAHAVSMGGSQIWLKEGEQMTVHDLLKAVAVVSANDGAVALAELVAGSEEGFVALMNQRAAELGMADTTFVNCTGLPAAGHLTSAYDIALMSRELILNHPSIREYTTIWMDTLRDGAFQLTNTNKLIRFYDGATGLKTGSTDSAPLLPLGHGRSGAVWSSSRWCSSPPTSQERFDTARALLGLRLCQLHPDGRLPRPGSAPHRRAPGRGGLRPAGAVGVQPHSGGQGPAQQRELPDQPVRKRGSPGGGRPETGRDGGDRGRPGPPDHPHRGGAGGWRGSQCPASSCASWTGCLWPGKTSSCCCFPSAPGKSPARISFFAKNLDIFPLMW